MKREKKQLWKSGKKANRTLNQCDVHWYCCCCCCKMWWIKYEMTEIGDLQKNKHFIFESTKKKDEIYTIYLHTSYPILQLLSFIHFILFFYFFCVSKAIEHVTVAVSNTQHFRQLTYTENVGKLFYFFFVTERAQNIHNRTQTCARPA